MSPRARTAVLLTVVAMAGALPFAGALGGGLVYDDIEFILHNPWIGDLRHLADIFLGDEWGFSGKYESAYYRPLRHVPYVFIRHFFGSDPFPYHLLNVALHALNCVLVFLIARRLPLGPSSEAGGHAALAAALLFAVHPVHAEAVAWASGLPDVMAAFFSLLALLLWIERPVVAAIPLALALLVKETAFAMPVVFIAYDIMLRRDGGNPGAAGLAWRYAPVAGAAALYLAVRAAVIGVSGSGFGRGGGGVSAALAAANIIPLAGAYLRLLVMPVNLSAVYDYRPAEWMRAWPLAAWGMAAALAGIAACRAARRRPMVGFLSVLAAAPLLPAFYLLFVSDRVIADRYLYLPSAGFCVLAAALVAPYAAGRVHKAAALAYAAGLPIVLLFAALAFMRAGVWKDGLSLWEDTAGKSPRSGTVRANLGIEYNERGDVRRAIGQLEAAAGLSPGEPMAYYNLGLAYGKLGDADREIYYYEKALSLRSDPEILVNLGAAYVGAGRYEDAIAALDSALAVNPGDPVAYLNLGNAYFHLGRIEESRQGYARAVEIRPSYAEAIYDLIQAYIRLGDAPSVAEWARRLESVSGEYHAMLLTDEDYMNFMGARR